LWDNVDHYFAMHVYGFFMTTLMARNCWVNHIWSVLIEITELSWQHKLPHFRECWWDHILGDMLSSNNIGIILGIYWIKYRIFIYSIF
jgi:phosphatidylserine synthase 2